MKKLLMISLLTITLIGCNKNKTEHYTVQLTQHDTQPPEVTVLDNDLGDILWTRVNKGIYNATLVGAFEGIPSFTVQPSSHPESVITGSFGSDDEFQVYTTHQGIFSDNILNFTTLEISVYK